jgi:glutamate decarboxylase
MINCLQNARYFADRLVASGMFKLLSDLILPIVAFRFKKSPEFSPFQLSQKLRERGWMLPAYRLPENAESITALRVVVKESFSRNMADILANDIINAYNILEGKTVDRLEPHPELIKQISI